MKTRFSSQDWELLSEYLDGQLDPGKQAKLEARLKTNPELKAALEDLQETRAMLRSLPKIKAPRSFKLTPQMVGQRRPAPRRIYPVLQLASAFASLILVFVLVGDLLGLGRAAQSTMMADNLPQEVIPQTVEREVQPFGAPAEEAAPEEPAAEALEAAPPELKSMSPEDLEEAQRALDATQSALRATEQLLEMAEVEREAPEMAAPAAGEQSPTEDAIQEQSQPYEPPSIAAAPPADTTQRGGQPALSGLRIAEILLAAVALVTGLVALLLRRAGI